MVIGKQEWLTLEEAAKQLGKSERSVQRLAAADQLRCKVDEATHHRLYHSGDIERIKEEGIRTERGEPPQALATRATASLSLSRETAQELLNRFQNQVRITEKLWRNLEEAAAYSGLSVRFLRDSIVAPEHYRPGENLIGMRAGRRGSWRIRRGESGGVRGMTLASVLDALYESEINFSISCFWDNGLDVKLGDEMNGYQAEGNVRTAEQAAEWLDTQAHIHFPRSKYAAGKEPPSESDNGDPAR